MGKASPIARVTARFDGIGLEAARPIERAGRGEWLEIAVSGKNSEPGRLRGGKAFHRKVQADWKADAEGDVQIELTSKMPGKKPGRLDVFVSENGSGLRAIVEIKDSDWDKMTPQAVRRNVKRQARQIWRYIELQTTIDGICPGIVFPKRPKDPERLKRIEQLFEDEGIPVVWEDESVAERKAR